MATAQRDHLITSNMPLAAAIAKEFKGQGVDLEDLTQEAYIGLIEAADGFDPERGVKFTTYARQCIRNALKDAVKREAGFQEVPVGHVSDMDKVIYG